MEKAKDSSKMPVLQDINFNSPKVRKKSRKSMLVLSDSEEEEDYDTAVGLKPKKKGLCLSDDSDDDRNSDGDEGYLSPLKKNDESKRKQHPDSMKKDSISASKAAKKTPNPKAKKRRRRSSARFLRLSGRFGDEDNEPVDEVPEEEQRQKLNEMYSQAIQLNAANKINAGNSWGLNIIDKMEKFLGDDDEPSTNAPIDVEEEGQEKGKRVNFTKASCTIDACVKIYSYRVDDAHLTSYKVLANLNRTDGGKKDKNDIDLVDTEGDANEDGGENQTSYAKRRASTAVVKTIETNMGKFHKAQIYPFSLKHGIILKSYTHLTSLVCIANLNISKLDSAYDIDPIFHKMSQKFDEGGAKGLLLVNLGVADDGCRIVLDSKEQSTSAEDAEVNEPELVDEETVTKASREDGMIDISSLIDCLDKKEGFHDIESVPFVPQLEELRNTYSELEEEGFVEAGKNMPVNSFRYANDAEEDKAAEEAIHREALERSTASGIQNRSYMLPNTSMMTTNLSLMRTSTEDSNQNDDFSDAGYDDYDDGDDGDFDNFIAMDDHAEKYSSDSFRNDFTMDETETFLANTAPAAQSSVPTFLDEICNGDALTQGTQFNYFNPEIIEKLTSGNQWAGSSHWKKNQTISRRSKTSDVGKNDQEPTNKKRKDTKRKISRNDKQDTFINFELESCTECLNSLLTKKKTRGRSAKIDSTQMTKASKQKYDKERNLLPIDAGINTKHFTDLFMRPNVNILQSSNKQTSNESQNQKTVGFLDNNQFDDGVDDSYDDGAGFQLAGEDFDDHEPPTHDDDFVVEELSGIRKVEKVRVKHATVAKKVDVKRLKKELWEELDITTAPKQLSQTQNEEKDDEDIEDCDRSIEGILTEEPTVSFKDTVVKLGATESQEDVSLPFYFICVLHLANEKGLKLSNGEHGLNDFTISRDVTATSN